MEALGKLGIDGRLLIAQALNFAILLFLLHSVGYFNPFLPITVNLIVLIVFFLSIFLLGAKSEAFFVAALFFWTITGFFKLVQVNVWAERSAIYVFESLLFGVILLLWENSGLRKKTK